ncbi:uncharacterized protein PAC_11769 [Phialocephala subalpina]|uniref:Uncharacterized protein n=1 Tax=Phialocephala subalpina TaxID=576137 RepID=A0A1L7XA34_9HELO|nr:uncharacterized protein PAC_11769 [Phialocephala subalpina]
MASNEIFWYSAFGSLLPLAINTMMQPSGRICGFDPSLRTYLRASPIVCAFDSITIIIRFITYRRLGFPYAVAAKKVLNARVDGHEDIESGGIRSLEQVLFLRCACFIVGVLSQVIKLMASTGIQWTQVWACFYLSSFLALEGMNTLSEFAVEEVNTNPAKDDPIEDRLFLFDRFCGGLAVLLQLALLAWVDLAVIPPDPNLMRKWTFRLLRFSAHFIVFLIHVPLMALQSDASTPTPNRRLGGLVMSMLVIYILLAGVQRLHFSQLILCFSVFWYVVHYDPSGTYRPQWAGFLG